MPDTYKTLTGTLYELSNTESTGLYQMELDNGDAIMVFFQPNTEVPPLHEHMALSVIDILRPDGAYIASSLVPFFTLLKG